MAGEEEDATAILDVLATVSGFLGPEPGHHRHTRYAIEVVVPGQGRAWLIHRKYYEFKRLHDALYAISFPGPRLPARQLWGPRTKAMLERRAESLDIWLQGTLAVWKSFYAPGEDEASLTVSTLLTVFLCRDAEFYVRSALAQSTVPSSSNSNTSTSHVIEQHPVVLSVETPEPSVHGQQPLHRGSGDDDGAATVTLGGLAGTNSSTSSLGHADASKLKRIMRRLSTNIKAMFSIAPAGLSEEAYARDDSSHHRRSAWMSPAPSPTGEMTAAASARGGVSATSASMASRPQQLSSSSPPIVEGTTAKPISWLMRGRTMFKAKQMGRREQRKFARDLDEGEDEELQRRRRLEKKLASEVKSSTLLRGGVVMMRSLTSSAMSHRQSSPSSPSKGLEVPSADAEGSIHRVFAVVENSEGSREEEDDADLLAGRFSPAATSGTQTHATVADPTSKTEHSLTSSKDVADASLKRDVEEVKVSGDNTVIIAAGGEGDGPSTTTTTTVMRRVISLTDDDGSELEWVFDSEGEDNARTDDDDENNRDDRQGRRQFKSSATSSPRRREGGSKTKKKKKSESRRRGDPLFLGRVVEYIPAPLVDADDDEDSNATLKTPARRELERLFVKCVVENPPEGGVDPLRHGYGMVSVPPSPRSREIYKRPWQAYTDKLLDLVERRLRAAHHPHYSQQSSTVNNDGDWIDSGSEDGASEADNDDDGNASETRFVQRTRWLQGGLLIHHHHSQRRRLEEEEDDEAIKMNNPPTEEDDDDLDSEGWASEAASESYEGGNDREVFGSWEEGTIWIGPKRAPAAEEAIGDVGVVTDEEEEEDEIQGSSEEDEEPSVDDDDDDEDGDEDDGDGEEDEDDDDDDDDEDDDDDDETSGDDGEEESSFYSEEDGDSTGDEEGQRDDEEALPSFKDQVESVHPDDGDDDDANSAESDEGDNGTESRSC